MSHSLGPTTTRLLLRAWKYSDRAPFARLNADPTVMQFMPRALTREESDAFCDRAQAHIERCGWGLWALESRDRGEFLGCVGLSVPTFDAHFVPCIEVGWRLAREHWGQGYASEAAAASLRFAFENLQLLQVVSFTVPSNLRSRRVMEHIGLSHDAAGDFEHPCLSPGHPLRRHVLYRLKREVWLRTRASGNA